MVRRAGEPESGDPAVDEAAYGVEGALAMLDEVYGRSSYDGAGATVIATVHYEERYVNAFWDGAQLVFGDGDGEVFDRFTKPVDVVGHELAHALTEHTAGLAYEGQSGALNESVSDVFAACLEQRLRGQTAAEADWLIGSDLFLPGVEARGLRDMAAPGTAYDDPVLGRDPQPAHMDDYVDTSADNGGVHLNSGIPNRAFHLAATAIGGSSAEGAGRIWYAALTGGRVGARTDFAGFAAATVAEAGEHAEAVLGGLGDGRGHAGRVVAAPGPGRLRRPARAPPAGWPSAAPAASWAGRRRARWTSTVATYGPTSSPPWSTGSTSRRSPAAYRSRTCTSTTSTSAAPGPPSPSTTSPTTSAGSPTSCWTGRRDADSP